jgi:ribonuclease BN (tRNA processing enzyme)
MKISFLGVHNTESRNTKLASLLIDDILALDAGGLTSSLSFTRQLKLRAVLLTHQHYDHIKDIPLLGMNFYLHNTNIDVYSIEDVYESVRKYLLNGDLYPKFMEEVESRATINFHIVKPNQGFKIEGYDILPLLVTHAVPAVGYQIASVDAKTVFYAGDTGPKLADCWQYISPQLIITEVTAPNRFEQFGRDKGHLTPCLLKGELLDFQKVKGYLPDVVAVHMNPSLESEIEAELTTIAGELGNSIKLAYERMKIEL